MNVPSPQRVLLVDDEPPARDRLRRLLGELPGVDVVGEAATGSDAVRLASELHPDVVLLDVRMPGMSGLEAARHMAELEQPPAVIFSTAYDAYAVEAGRVGDEYIVRLHFPCVEDHAAQVFAPPEAGA